MSQIHRCDHCKLEAPVAVSAIKVVKPSVRRTGRYYSPDGGCRQVAEMPETFPPPEYEYNGMGVGREYFTADLCQGCLRALYRYLDSVFPGIIPTAAVKKEATHATP